MESKQWNNQPLQEFIIYLQFYKTIVLPMIWIEFKNSIAFDTGAIAL